MLRDRLSDLWFDYREASRGVMRWRTTWLALAVLVVSLLGIAMREPRSVAAVSATVPMPALALPASTPPALATSNDGDILAQIDAARPVQRNVQIAAAVGDRMPDLVASLNPKVDAAKPPAMDQTKGQGPDQAKPDPQAVKPQQAAPQPTAPQPTVPQQPAPGPMAQTQPPAPLPPAPPSQPAPAPAPQAGPKAPAVPAPQSPQVPPAPPLVVTDVSGPSIAVEINRGKLVKLATPAETVFIANPEIADVQVKSPKLIYIYGRRAGETALYAVDDQENVLINSRVVVTHNIGALRGAINGAMPQNGIKVVTVGDSIVLSGDVASATQVEDARRIAARFAPGDGAVVNNLRVNAPNQINLRVRIAEVSRDTLKQLGFNWENLASIGGFAFGLATGNPVLAVGGAFVTRSDGTNSVTIRGKAGGVDINGLVDALATQNLITVLAEPNLTALSGETANFLAGGEFPIPVPGGNAATTIEFKRFGVSLAFTPTVLDGNRINLKVRPEVSQLSQVGAIKIDSISVPSLTTRRAETTVELASGQSFAIAGLMQNNAQQDARKMPLLGEIPVLGALFKSDRFQRNETELVIIVTPYLVRPAAPGTLSSPTDGYVPPTDADRYVNGTMHRQQVPPRQQAPAGRNGGGLVGPSGFQLE